MLINHTSSAHETPAIPPPIITYVIRTSSIGGVLHYKFFFSCVGVSKTLKCEHSRCLLKIHLQISIQTQHPVMETDKKTLI